MFTIRKSKIEDIPRILEILAYARDFMKKTGNPNQWKDDRPAPSLIYNDVEKGQSYVMEEDGHIFATFALVCGKDPTYDYIEDGAWPDDDPYCTIHRIAGDGSHRGIFEKCIEFGFAKSEILRIDTYIENKIMLHLLKSAGFMRCGVIYVDDGTPREAFYKRR